MNRFLGLKFKRNIIFFIVALLYSGALYLSLYLYKMTINYIDITEAMDIWDCFFNGKSDVKTTLIISIIILLISTAIVLSGSIDVIKAGILGEKKAKNYLKELTKHGYKIISNVLVPKENGGFRELDFILVGPKGIFVVEAKNITGSISGNISNKELERVKVGKRGKRHSSKIDNPIYQVKGQVYTLISYLRSRNIKNYVDYFIAFTNEKVSLNISCSDSKLVKVNSNKDIVDYIENIESKRVLEKSEINNIYKEISSLKIYKNLLNPSFIVGCIKDDFKKIKKSKISIFNILDLIRNPLIFINGILIFTLIISFTWMAISLGLAVFISPLISVFVESTVYEIINMFVNIELIVAVLIKIISVLTMLIHSVISSTVLFCILKFILFTILKIVNFPYKKMNQAEVYY